MENKFSNRETEEFGKQSDWGRACLQATIIDIHVLYTVQGLVLLVFLVWCDVCHVQNQVVSTFLRALKVIWFQTAILQWGSWIGDYRKYPYATMGSMIVLPSPLCCLWKFKNAISDALMCPPSSKIVNSLPLIYSVCIFIFMSTLWNSLMCETLHVWLAAKVRFNYLFWSFYSCRSSQKFLEYFSVSCVQAQNCNWYNLVKLSGNLWLNGF